MAELFIQLKNANGDLLYPRTRWAAVLDKPSFVTVEQLNTKQDILTQAANAGNGITINNGAISVNPNGSVFEFINQALTLKGINNATSGQFLMSDGNGGISWSTPGTTYVLPPATSNALGGIKIGYSTSPADKNYAVLLSNDNKAYVNVPWTDTIYTHPTYTTASAAAVKVGRDSTGHVVLGTALTASDVGALSTLIKYGAGVSVSFDGTNYILTTTLLDQDGNTLGTAANATLPFSDFQPKITSTNKLDADLVDDSSSTNKFITATQSSKLAGIQAGAEVNVQSDWNQTNTLADDYIKNKPTHTSDFINDGEGSSTFLEASDVVDTYSSSGTAPISGTGVAAALATLPTPMQFKGSVGTGGTITWANLPAAAVSNSGFTYKVITDHATTPICQVGDTIISNGTSWVVIPSGDEPAGTVTSVAIGTDGGISISGSPITSSGTITISNTGVRSISIHGNQLRINTNGTDDDITIPYATNATNLLGGTNGQVLISNGTQGAWGSLSLQEEYFQWGPATVHQQNSVSPLGMALSSEHSSNKLAFINADALLFEYSSDGGSTYTTYTMTNTAKRWFCTGIQAVPIGRASASTSYSTSSRTRVTITAQDGTHTYVYTDPRKLLINVEASGDMTVLIEYRTGYAYQNLGSWETYGTYTLSGWSGWNDIPLILDTLGGFVDQTSNYWQLRLTFAMTSFSSSYPTTAYVRGIRLFGQNCWYPTSNLGEINHLYSYDASQNASFPASLSAAGNLSVTGIGTISGSLSVNTSQGAYAPALSVVNSSAASNAYVAQFSQTLTTSASTTWINGISIMAGNMAPGGTSGTYANFCAIQFGKAWQTKDSGNLTFHYSATGSDNNWVSLGLYGVDHVLNITGAGRVGIKNTAPAYELDVTGTAKVTGLKIGTAQAITQFGSGLTITTPTASTGELGLSGFSSSNEGDFITVGDSGNLVYKRIAASDIVGGTLNYVLRSNGANQSAVWSALGPLAWVSLGDSLHTYTAAGTTHLDVQLYDGTTNQSGLMIENDSEGSGLKVKLSATPYLGIDNSGGLHVVTGRTNLSVAVGDHGHGYITDAGAFPSSGAAVGTVGTGDALVLMDVSDSRKISYLGATLDTTHGGTFLRRDGTWQVPPATSGITSVWKDNSTSYTGMPIQFSGASVMVSNNRILVTISNPCLIAGTKITMADGSKKNIEDVQRGDEVMSYDINTHQLNRAIVIDNTRTGESLDYTTYFFDDGQYIIAYGRHPVFNKTLGRSADIASEFTVGDETYNIAGETVTYTGSLPYHIRARHAVAHYDLTTSNNLYFANGILNSKHIMTQYHVMDRYGMEMPTEIAAIAERKEALLNHAMCNKNEAYLKAVALKFKEKEQLKRRIAEAKQHLADSDYIVQKFTEGLIGAAEWVKAKTERASWRSKINDIEPSLAKVRAEIAKLRTNFSGYQTDAEAWPEVTAQAEAWDNEAIDLYRAWLQNNE